ncbi:MAG: succinyl-CoA synthetase beta subunit [Actinomycetota bacterium]|jgi:succinyl-CoA synthetase beta subunit|nr:succinyl-CoA synthetase beta subunit [Actinomycetota bacterium]
MDLLEYQGKQVLAAAGLPASSGTVARTVDEVVAAADTHGYPAVVKAQVRVGGRGKAGGVKVVGDAAAARAAGEAILGMDIKGHTVEVVLVEPACDIAAEYYASFTFDRSARLHLGLLSAQGGVEIEQVALRDPDAVARVHVDPSDGLSVDAARDLAARAGLSGAAAAGVAALLPQLFAAYVAADADLVEINPLVLTAGGDVIALDAKVTLDDNAAFRHPEWAEWRASEELDPRERRARDKGLNYVGLDGTVGIIGNGAGLVMATLDVVSQAGGSAANFLDIGGGASAEVMAAALDVVASDDKVGAILVNIFGGITRGDEVANGILQALAATHIRPPIVVRLDGTNAEEGRAILAGHLSDSLRSEPTMSDAARTAVALADGKPPA